jgi:AcrR family transcriptional regulator
LHVNCIPTAARHAAISNGEVVTTRTARLAGPAKTAELRRERPGDKDFAGAGLQADAARVVGHGDKIVGAAYQLLNECGLDGLTVQAVLKKTGLNRRTFYERFSGKDDLVLAVFERSLLAVEAECRAQIENMRSPLERLKFIVTYLVVAQPADGRGLANNIRRNAALCREHMRLAEARPNELRAALRPLTTLLSEQLVAGIACGEVRNSAPERLANLVYNLVSTTVHAEVLAYEAGTPDWTHRTQLAEDLWEFCRGAISA